MGKALCELLGDKQVLTTSDLKAELAGGEEGRKKRLPSAPMQSILNTNLTQNPQEPNQQVGN